MPISQSDLATLVRANLGLPIFSDITARIAIALPDRGYCRYHPDGEYERSKMAWSMSQKLIEDYCVLHFKTIVSIYDYIVANGVKLAIDVLENLPK